MRKPLLLLATFSALPVTHVIETKVAHGERAGDLGVACGVHTSAP